MAYLIDTATISELKKPTPSANVISWFAQTDPDQLFVSVLTFGEILKGISKLPPSKKRRELERWLAQKLPDFFAPTQILPIDLEVAQVWGRIVGTLAAKGVNVPSIDSLIAATCLAHNLICVTPNVSDIERCGAAVLDPTTE